MKLGIGIIVLGGIMINIVKLPKKRNDREFLVFPALKIQFESHWGGY
jgi:hypothetical protein